MPRLSLVNDKRLIARLKERFSKIADKPRVSVIVGYTASYAIYVHENLEAHHTVGQAKFLETAARVLRAELRRIVLTATRAGATLLQALLMAGLRLQRESQLLVPVKTGNLKNSAFTREE